MAAGKVVGVVLVGGAVIVGVSAASWLIWFAQQGSRIVQQTFDADNVILNYEYFFNQYNTVLGLQQSLQNARNALRSFEQSAGPRPEWRFTEQQEYNRLSSLTLGIENQINILVSDYNARASMANRSVFQSRTLPDFLTYNSETGFVTGGFLQ